MFRATVGALPWLALAMSRLTNAACECGYSVNQTTDASFGVYTDLMENDFLHTSGDNVTEFGWRPQEYNVSADTRVPYGKQFFVENVETNALKDANAWSGDSEKGGEAGLKLWVRGDHSHGYVQGAEAATVRGDSLYGSFRVGMKLSAQNGTCGSFYWYYNDSQEIDMEFLSSQFKDNGGAVNLVIHTPESVLHGNDAANTSAFKVQQLPFRPDEKFHEYRFDWSKDRVAFYVDGEYLYEMTENIPTEGGRMFMNHWSNGDPLWSGGPPNQDTAMTISYMKAYFNSTDTSRSDAYKKRCPTFDPSKVCPIPAQTSPPDPSEGTDGAKTYFFTLDTTADKSPGQTKYHTTNSAAGLSVSIAIPILVTLFSWALAL